MATSLQNKIDDLEARFKAESLEDGRLKTESDFLKKNDRVSKSVNFSLASPSPRRPKPMLNNDPGNFGHRAVPFSQSIPKRLNENVHQGHGNLEIQKPVLKQTLSGTPRKSSNGNCSEIGSSPINARASTSPKASFQLETPSPGNELLGGTDGWRSYSVGNYTQQQPEATIVRPGSAGSLGALSFGGGQTRRRQVFNFPSSHPVQKSHDSIEIEQKYTEIMKSAGRLAINGRVIPTDIREMEPLGELGHGTCGHVIKMMHRPTKTVMAVKQMRRSGNCEENKRIIMDLDVVMKCHNCPYIVLCIGTFITSTDVWICMELMTTCLDKLMKKLGEPFPEKILGKITVATLNALHYLKEEHGVIHRDVKPSNILLDERGAVKLCDFGISGRLVDSKAKTRSAGCAAYMAPERIDPPDPSKPDYDIRADVWSLGLTLVELATGEFPYKDCQTDFEVLTKVLHDEQPRLPPTKGFSMDFEHFVNLCLAKDYTLRPKYPKLLDHNFVKRYTGLNVDVAAWYSEIRKKISCDGQRTEGGGGRVDGTPDPSSLLCMSNLLLRSPAASGRNGLPSTATTCSQQNDSTSPFSNLQFCVGPPTPSRRQQTSATPSSNSTSSSPILYYNPDVRRFDPLCSDLPIPASTFSPCSSPSSWSSPSSSSSSAGATFCISASSSALHSYSPSANFYSHSRISSPYRSPPSAAYSSSLFVPHFQNSPLHGRHHPHNPPLPLSSGAAPVFHSHAALPPFPVSGGVVPFERSPRVASSCPVAPLQNPSGWSPEAGRPLVATAMTVTLARPQGKPLMTSSLSFVQADYAPPGRVASSAAAFSFSPMHFRASKSDVLNSRGQRGGQGSDAAFYKPF